MCESDHCGWTRFDPGTCSGPLSPAVVAALPPQDRVSAAVSVIGQRVPYSGEEPSPPPHRPTGREPIRALRPAKGESAPSELQFSLSFPCPSFCVSLCLFLCLSLSLCVSFSQMDSASSFTCSCSSSGSQSFSSRTSPASDMCEGVVGRG